jgi:hypothetical protein
MAHQFGDLYNVHACARFVCLQPFRFIGAAPVDST